MKLNYASFLVILFIGLFLINGCASQTTNSKSTSDCHALDGTWKGVISDSGSLEVTREVDGEDVTTHNPFTAQYDFEMTIECTDEFDMYAGSEFSSSSYKVNHIKASHPIFGCVQRCTPIPVSDKGGISSWLYIKEDGLGAMQIAFTNGAAISMFVDENRISVSPDGNKMELYIPEGVENWETIGSVGAGGEYRTIETDNCKLLGNKNCSVEYLNKTTIILKKES